LDYPWNRNTDDENIIRASSWKEIYNIIYLINKEEK